jgi:hypothetical protein
MEATVLVVGIVMLARALFRVVYQVDILSK